MELETNELSDWMKAKIEFDYAIESLIYENEPVATGAHLLEVIARLSSNPKRALEMLADFCDEGLIPDDLARLKDMVEIKHTLASIKIDMAKKSTISERDIQNHFFSNLNHYLPGACKVSAKNHTRSVPDGFVQIEEKIAPIEVKLELFGERALSQLLGYMRRYELDIGIAVAQRCTAELPSNVKFVQIKERDVKAQLSRVCVAGRD